MKSVSRLPATLPIWAGIAFSAVFTFIIWLLAPRLESIPHLPDSGYLWYYWRLPEVSTIVRLSYWVPYLLHQVALWWIIALAQRGHLKYINGLHPLNVAALAVNAVFIVIHLVQTQVFYSALAEDVSILASQGSVIVLLVMVLILENQRRGLFFGKPAPFGKTAVEVVKRYHGYVFSWAAVFTFWYHPMEATPGHLVGFFYMFLLLVQSSLFFTRAHVNRYWTVTLEVLVLIHGALVAYVGGSQIWTMFAFGFGFIFVVTQLHGLGWPRWAKLGVTAFYFALVVLFYGTDVNRMTEIPRIPVIEYGSAFLLAGIIGGVAWIRRKVRPTLAASPAR